MVVVTINCKVNRSQPWRVVDHVSSTALMLSSRKNRRPLTESEKLVANVAALRTSPSLVTLRVPLLPLLPLLSTIDKIVVERRSSSSIRKQTCRTVTLLGRPRGMKARSSSSKTAMVNKYRSHLSCPPSNKIIRNSTPDQRAVLTKSLLV